MRRISILLLALLAVAGPARAGIDAAGTTSANFLSVGNGASVLAMGGAAIGTGGSLNAAAWNPASLGQLAGPQYSISHATLAMQTSQDWLAAGGRVRGGATRWSLNAIYENDGDFEGRDALGASTGTFNASNLAFGATVARPFGSTFALGAGVKWVNQYLGEVTGSGLGFDVGVQGRAGALGFGVAARNVGGNVKFDGASFPMPAVYGFGASWTDAVHGLRFNLDANFPSAYYNDVRFGGEWMWQNRIALRGGYRMELGAGTGEPLGGPTFGMGAGSNGMWVDYAFLAGQSEAQGAHRMSFSVHPGFMNPGGLAMAPTPIEPREQLANARASEPRAQQPQSMAIVREPAKQAASAAPAPAPVAIVREPVTAPSAPAAPSATVAPKAAPQLPAPVLSIVRASEASAPVAPVARPQIAVPADAAAAPLAARETDAAPRAMRAGQAVRVPKLVVPSVEPVAIVREPAAAAPAPAPVAIVRASEPAAPVLLPRIEAPVAADAAPLAARSSTAAPRAMRAGQAVRVPKLVVPKLEPVAIVREPVAPAIEAPAPKPAVQLAASAPVAPVVVPRTAPSTEPIARPQAIAPPPAPAKRPATIVVQPGQTLADLAKQWDNSVPSLMMENNLVSEQVKPGQKLRLPPAGKK